VTVPLSGGMFTLGSARRKFVVTADAPWRLRGPWARPREKAWSVQRFVVGVCRWGLLRSGSRSYGQTWALRENCDAYFCDEKGDGCQLGV